MSEMLKIMEATNAVMEKARRLHPGIPKVITVLGASGASRSGQKHGHYAPRSWGSRNASAGHGAKPSTGDEASREVYGEILLAGESLERGAVGTLGTILHELVHAYCDANNIKDTSNGHRYHNTKFKAIAEEFGLDIEKAETIGWSLTEVPKATQEAYKEELEALEAAIKVHRLGFLDLQALGIAEPEKAKPKVRKMQCPKCQEPLAVTKKWWGLQGNGGGDYEYGAGLICAEHEVEYELFTEGGE